MASGSVRKGIQDRVTDIIKGAVGDRVSNFDTKLEEAVPFENMPYIVVTVRSKDQSGPGEMGTVRELWQWLVHIYYIDVKQDYYQGEEARDSIVDDIETALETAYNLNNLSISLENAQPERVYDSNFSSVLFDSSGQDGYYTFVSELYLSVDTQR